MRELCQGLEEGGVNKLYKVYIVSHSCMVSQYIIFLMNVLLFI